LVEFSLKYIITSDILNEFKIKVLLLQEKCKQCSPFAVKLNTKICILDKQDYFPFWNKILVLITI